MFSYFTKITETTSVLYRVVYGIFYGKVIGNELFEKWLKKKQSKYF